MSTPIARNNRLEGLALYAPRRARERSLSDADTAAVLPLQQEDDDPAAAEEPAKLSHDELTEIQDRVDQAIREAVNLRHLGEDPDPAGSATAAPHRPSAAMGQPERLDSEAPSRARRPRGIPPHRFGLDPELVPEPPAELHQRRVFQPLMRFSLVVVFAAIVAYGLTMLASLQPKALWLKGVSQHIASTVPHLHTTVPAYRPPPQLVVGDQQAFANQPLPLAVDVEHAREDESLMFDGLAQGTTLSAGAATGPFSWRLPFAKLRGLYLYAPKDFVGIMKTTVDLFGADKRLLDARVIQLKWTTREPKPVPAPAAATASAPVETAVVASADPAIPATPGAAAAIPAAPRVEPIDPAEAAMLMQRGRDFLGAGDISAARIAFGRLNDAGMPEAALALADTYDPDYLAAHSVVGVSGDRAKARALYERAKQLGSAEAGRILAQMVAK